MNSRTYAAINLPKSKECATVGSFRNSKNERTFRMKEQKSKSRNEKA